MVKRIILLSLVFVLAFVIQIYMLNNWSFWGVKANILLVLVVGMSVFVKPNITIPYVFVIGIFADLVFSFSFGKYLFIYLVIMVAIMFVSKIYNKQNIVGIIVVTLGSVMLFEYLLWVFNSITLQEIQNVFSVLILVIKEAIVTIAIEILCIKLFKKLGSE